MKRRNYNDLLRWKQVKHGLRALATDGVQCGEKVTILLVVFSLLVIGCGKDTSSEENQTPTVDSMPVIEWVDLGLPSGVLWATCNVGANAPEENGGYYAWGETSTKAMYSWDTYIYSNGDFDALTKYCSSDYYGYEGYTDTLTTLEDCDDVAITLWGNGARIPTKEEWQELLDNCLAQWISFHGKRGYMFYGRNENSIFLPAVGYRWDDWDGSNGSNGLYWSSSLNKELPASAYFYTIAPCNGGGIETGTGRIAGYAIRPVRSR